MFALFGAVTLTGKTIADCGSTGNAEMLKS
jgi:hypothetical protein